MMLKLVSDKVIPFAQDACYVNSGQTCVALTRTFVHEDIYDEFVRKSTDLAIKTRDKFGDPFAEGILYGPQIDKTQFDKILDLIDSGVKQGAKLECGGKRLNDKVGQISFHLQIPSQSLGKI